MDDNETLNINNYLTTKESTISHMKQDNIYNSKLNTYMILQNNLSVYDTDCNFYNTNKISKLLLYSKSNYLSTYNDIQILIDDNEHISTLYDIDKTNVLLPKILNYYTLYSITFPWFSNLSSSNPILKYQHWKKKKMEELEYGILPEENSSKISNRNMSIVLKSNCESFIYSPYSKASDIPDISISMIKKSSNNNSVIQVSDIFKVKEKEDEISKKKIKNIKGKTISSAISSKKSKHKEIKETKEKEILLNKPDKKSFHCSINNQTKPKVSLITEKTSKAVKKDKTIEKDKDKAISKPNPIKSKPVPNVTRKVSELNQNLNSSKNPTNRLQRKLTDSKRSNSPSINVLHSKASKIISTCNELRQKNELLSKKLFSSFKKDVSIDTNNSKSINEIKETKEIKDKSKDLIRSLSPNNSNIKRNLFKIEINQRQIKDDIVINEEQEFNLKPTTRRENNKSTTKVKSLKKIINSDIKQPSKSKFAKQKIK